MLLNIAGALAKVPLLIFWQRSIRKSWKYFNSSEMCGATLRILCSSHALRTPNTSLISVAATSEPARIIRPKITLRTSGTAPVSTKAAGMDQTE